MLPLVLASTSPFRQALLEKLGLDFVSASPQADETALPGENASALVERLAEAKARAVAAEHPKALIIGSDQVACVDDEILGKPGNRANAIAQLTKAAGRTVTFQTGLCLFNSATGNVHGGVEPFRVRFRQLQAVQIARYVDREKPFNCAGSFKSEGFGITLFSALEGRDPNALIGLPLILLVEMLAAEGLVLP